MIDEARNLEIYGYTSDELKPQSHKPIVAVCEECGRYRVLAKRSYRELCHQCAQRATPLDTLCSVCGAVGVSAKGMCKRCYNKHRNENLSPEQIEKRNARQRKFYENRTPEQIDKNNACHRNENLSPEQIEKRNARARKFYENLSPEQIEKNNARQRNENRTPEQIEKRNASARKFYENRTPEQIEKHNTYNRKYREDNKEHTKQYREDNKEHIAARDKQYREDNKEHAKQYAKQYQKDNKEHIAAHAKKQHEDNREANGYTVCGSEEHRIKCSCAQQGISIDEWDGFAVESKYCPKFNNACRERNREKYGRRCFVCGKTEAENGKRLSVHHVDMEKQQGCDGHVWQLVPVCMKHHNHDEETRARIQYLLEHVW